MIPERDDKGYLVDVESWTEEVGRELAAEQGLTLGEAHWKLIEYLRWYYVSFENHPTLRSLCMGAKVSLQRVYELFPEGPLKGLCKIAGLPRPPGCTA